MRLALPPAFLLAILLILLGTQLAYVAWPGRPHYLLRLALSVGAFMVGELTAALGPGSQLAVGELHPVTDLGLLAIFQFGASRWAGRIRV